jgi:non-specific serine/threonine protein kinase
VVAGAALELAGALWWFWLMRGHLDEGREWLARVLSAAPTESPAGRARVLLGASAIALFQGDAVSSHAFLDESLALGKETHEKWTATMSVFLLGNIAAESGDYARAAVLAEECRALANECRRGYLAVQRFGIVAERACDPGPLPAARAADARR